MTVKYPESLRDYSWTFRFGLGQLQFLILLLAMLLFLVSTKVHSSENEPPIYWRSIVYFYPDDRIVGEDELKLAFKDFDFVSEFPEKTENNTPLYTYEVIKNFDESYPVPDMSYLAYFGRGVTKAEAESIQGSKLAVVIDAMFPISTAIKNVYGLNNAVFRFANQEHGLIWDSETRELFSPIAWKEKRISSWDKSGFPVIEDQIVIHAYQAGEGVRAITLGMSKFGLPDIVVDKFSWSLNGEVGSVINVVAQSIFEGTEVTDSFIRVDIDKLRDGEFKTRVKNSLKENAVQRIDVGYREGKWESGDPNNYLIELTFDHIEGSSLSEKQSNFVHALFGWEDDIAYVRHNQLIKEASKRAREKLPSLKKDFNEGLAPGEYIQLKAPFDTDDEGVEWMWVEVLAWSNSEIKGLLKNEPYFIESLRAGMEVSINQDDVFDYIRTDANGNREGNETGELIQKYQVR
ncbi:hypothetical protein D515_00965 [Grimontia indica]|uniref:DUF2314 domain-containing protein n=1 Tax=Grimontia indica TaxID=1056512 RepID=R1IQT2_9GAMM|nr:MULTISPECIES: DUF2314 domain-containing protein [Grimontia]EOD79832.1 hypothetical protein D515_00965 [Grimontia indica]